MLAYRLLIMGVLLIAGTCTTAAAQSMLDLSKFHLVFQDEFNYSSQSDLINNSPWQFTPGGSLLTLTGLGHETEDEYYDASAVTVSNGVLQLEATPSTAYVYPMSYDYTENGATVSKELHYKSGWIKFKDNFVGDLFPCNGQPDGTCGGWSNGYYYGAFEIRCKLAPGTGTWPAFWLFNGPTEIDVFEGGSDKKQLFSNVIKWDDKTNPHSQELFQKEGADLTAEYHTYTTVWTPQKVTFFFDGREIRSVTSIPTAPFPATIVVNLAIISDADTETWPIKITGKGNFVPYTRMLVDYIRVYKPNTANDYSYFKTDMK